MIFLLLFAFEIYAFNKYSLFHRTLPAYSAPVYMLEIAIKDFSEDLIFETRLIIEPI